MGEDLSEFFGTVTGKGPVESQIEEAVAGDDMGKVDHAHRLADEGLLVDRAVRSDPRDKILLPLDSLKGIFQ